jgi:DNA-binding PadR family transcriptional regulator
MPKAKRKPAAADVSRNGLREALLGLIAIKPMTGYDLTRSYRRALQQIWYAPLGQVYPTLRKMKRDGLLRMSVKAQRHRPDRKVYTLTAEGRKLLVAWLSQPAALPRMHHEFIHKLFLLSNVDARRRGALLEAYIKRSDEWARDLRRAEAMLEPSLNGPNAESAWFQLLSLRHLCRIVECEAVSAREIAEAIRNPAVTAKAAGRSAAATVKEIAAFAGQSLSPAG